MTEKPKRCVICRETYEGYGHNADPVKPGKRCCELCNSLVVVPKRLSHIFAHRKNKSPGNRPGQGGEWAP